MLQEAKTSDNIKKVAIYCRLSDEDRNKSDSISDSRSIQTQKNLLIEHALNHGWVIYNIYSDDDWSGADSDRPDYNRLLYEAQAGKFDIVLCKHQSRFTRDMEHVEKYINNKFKEWGVRFVSILDGADTDLSGNKKSRQINGLVNEWYLEDLSENVKASFKTRKKSGKYISSFAPYGYAKDPKDINHLVIDHEAADIVKTIFKLYLKGNSQEKIACFLNQEKILCPTRYKKEILNTNFKSNLASKETLPIWRSSAICQILSNEVYIGNSAQNKSESISYKNHTRISIPRENWIIVEDTHEPIISKSDFYKVQVLRKKRFRPTKKGEVSLFSGLLKCGYCKSNLILNSVKKNGYKYYRCIKRYPNLEEHSCCINEEHLILAVKNELKSYIQLLIDPKSMSDKVEQCNGGFEELQKLEKSIDKLQKKCDSIDRTVMNLYEDKICGNITEEQFKRINSRYIEEQQQIFVDISEKKSLYKKLLIKKEKYSEITSDEFKLNEIKRYLEFNDLKRELLLELLDRIEVFNGEKWGTKNFKIYWKF